MADLAESTLALIFEFESAGCSSTAAFSAWLSGNRKLMAKMVNSGVAHLNIQNPNRGAVIKLPACINKWKLSSLVINASSSTFEPHVSLNTEALSRWRSTLRHLELSFKDSVDLLFDSSEKPATTSTRSASKAITTVASSNRTFGASGRSGSGTYRHPASEKGFEENALKRRKVSEDATQDALHALNISGENTPAPSELIVMHMEPESNFPSESIGMSLTPLFPRLESLVLRIHKLTDTDRLFKLLPPTLTSLALDWEEFNFFIASFSALPPHLKHLLLPSYKLVFNEHNLPTLPQPNEIETLTGEMNEAAFTLLVRDWSTLLPALNSFPSKRRMNWFTELGFDREARGDEALPSYPLPLRSLNLADESRVNFNIPLPARLTSLHCKRCPPEFIATWLPQSLTSMVVNKLEWKLIESSDWPSSLTSLVCLRDSELPFSIASRLPRTIKKLSPKAFGNAEEAAKFDVDEAILVGRHMLLDNAVDRQLWSEAKQELLERASTGESKQMAVTERYIEAIENGGLFGLPIGLAALDITCVFPMAVPPKLAELTVRVEDDSLLQRHFPNPSQFYELIPSTTVVRVHLPSS